MTPQNPLILTLLLISPSYALHYTYDDLNRRLKVTDHAGNQLHYHYDAGGNLISIETQKPPLLTDLTHFTATPFPSQIRLEWQMGTEHSYAGFNRLVATPI